MWFWIVVSKSNARNDVCWNIPSRLEHTSFKITHLTLFTLFSHSLCLAFSFLLPLSLSLTISFSPFSLHLFLSFSLSLSLFLSWFCFHSISSTNFNSCDLKKTLLTFVCFYSCIVHSCTKNLLRIASKIFQTPCNCCNQFQLGIAIDEMGFSFAKAKEKHTLKHKIKSKTSE